MYRLLVVDDEKDTRMSICDYFPWHDFGFHIAGQAENGRHALELLQQLEVDVILCDIKMPIMSGVELARVLYERRSPIKLVFLSGYRDYEYLQQAILYGARNYILKPTRYQELSQAFTQLKQELDAKVAPPNIQPPAASTVGDDGDDRIVRAVKRYAAENLATISLDEAARLVRMNPSYFSQYFTRQTGRNFSAYLMELKMKRAAELLHGVDHKIYEISELVGYTSPKTFTRMFTRYYGKNPRAFRNELGIEE